MSMDSVNFSLLLLLSVLVLCVVSAAKRHHFSDAKSGYDLTENVVIIETFLNNEP